MSSFLESIEPEQNASALGQVMAQVNALVALRERIEKKEEELKDLKKQEQTLDGDVIPNLLLSHGLEALSLSNGRTLSIKDDLAVGIPKNAEGRAVVLKWLEENGAGDIIVDELSLENPDKELTDYLTERGHTFVVDKSVNTNKLKAWFRGALGITKNSVQSIVPNDVPKEANLFLYKQTLIK